MSHYTGITSQAVLTDNNAETIAVEAYRAGNLSTSTTGILPMAENGSTAGGGPVPLAIVHLLRTAVDAIPSPQTGSVAPSSQTAARPMTTVTVSDTMPDGMGGSMSYTLSADDQTGNFSGTLDFHTWHGDAGETFDGRTVVSGNIDLGTGEFTRIDFSFNPITFTDESGSFSIYGDVSLTVGTSSDSALLDLILTNGISGETVWINDYSVTTTYGPDGNLDGEPDYVDADLSGRIYLADHGYVDIATTTAFRCYTGYDLPSRGQMVVTGAGGNSVQFTVIEGVPVSSGYYVEADLDGLPGYEWRSVDRPWT